MQGVWMPRGLIERLPTVAIDRITGFEGLLLINRGSRFSGVSGVGGARNGRVIQIMKIMGETDH